MLVLTWGALGLQLQELNEELEAYKASTTRIIDAYKEELERRRVADEQVT